MSLKRKLPSDSSQSDSKRLALPPLLTMHPSQGITPPMDLYNRQEEDYLTANMFTSQAQDFSMSLPAAAPMNLDDGNLLAFDASLGMSAQSWTDFQDYPALTPSKDSDLSSASSECINPWPTDSISRHEPTPYEMHSTIVPQMSTGYPLEAQWTSVATDSPLSMPSTYDEPLSQDPQMFSLDIGTSAFEPSLPAFDEYMIPTGMVSTIVPGMTEQPLSPMEARYGQGNTPFDEMPRRLSNESNPRDARQDPRYKLRAHPDGLYHCPFPECDHEPDKLKCNYDKHLDAHLRPYRCIRQACQGIQFSSTACVLRHEREAHGMHGHGHKPYTCRFRDCDRANPESGFPRKWNLKDHMKRVHHYDEEAAQKSASSPMTPPESPDMHIPGPQRTKRSGRVSPKPRNSKDDTIKASAMRRSSRMPLPQNWEESMTKMPDMPQVINNYETTWDGSLTNLNNWTG